MQEGVSFDGPAGAWADRKPNYWRSFRALMKKTLLTKIRHWAAIVEIIGAILIFNIIESKLTYSSRYE